MGNLLQIGRNHQLNEWLYLLGFVYQIERPKSGICTQGRRWHRSPVTLTTWCVWGTAPSPDYCLLCPSPTSASGTHGTPPSSVSKLSGNAKLAVVTPRSMGHNSITSVHADDVEKLIEILTIKSRNGLIREIFQQEFYYFCISALLG